MIPFLNEAGRQALAVASAMLWQTAVLVLVLVLVEILAGRRLQASLRCGLWLLVILKLLLPPSLKSPVSPGYWIGRWIAPPLVLPAGPKTTPISGVNPRISGSVSPPWTEVSPTGGKRTADRPASTGPRLHTTGALAGIWALGTLAVSLGILRRHQQVRRLINTARQAPGELLDALQGAATELGLRRVPELRLTQADHSPAVSGILHPVIVLPAGLATRLPPEALRDVLLHELVHIRRRDLWLNLPQALAQIVWWWSPFVWLANARIRFLREQAVDEQVMLLNPGPEDSTYPSTLVAVARYCAIRPVWTLNFVGILESRHHLRSRVERLLKGPLPPRAGLGRRGWLTLVLTACLALPMAFARRVDASGPDPGLSSRLYRVDADRLMTALEERVSYSVEDFSVEDLPATHGGDYPSAPGGFIIGAGGRQRTLESRTGALLGKYLAKAGVTFPALDPRAPISLQKTFAVNAARRTLMIRATDTELDSIDAALRNLALTPDELQSADPNLAPSLSIPASRSSPSGTPDQLRWLPWSEDSVRAARQKGQTVLVDFTAKWCLTCKVNRAHVLNDPKVRERLAAGNIVTLAADYTHENSGIAEELRRLNRPGIPAVVIYPADPNATPLVLPEQLTVPIVLDALPDPGARSAPSAPSGTRRPPENLPATPRETPENQALLIRVHSSPPHYSIQGEFLTAEQLKTRIRSEVEARPNTQVTLDGEERALKPMLNALDVCGHAGVTRIQVRTPLRSSPDSDQQDSDSTGTKHNPLPLPGSLPSGLGDLFSSTGVPPGTPRGRQFPATPDPNQVTPSPPDTSTPTRPADQIQIRIFELDPKNGSTVLLESAELETREQVLSGTTSQRQPGDAFIAPLSSSKRRTIADLVRPAPSGRRIDISFAEANVAGAPDPNTAALELLPVVRPGETTVDLFVVLRRSPNDPVPIRRSATLKPGESLVIVSGYPSVEAGTKPLMFAMTPNFVDPPSPETEASASKPAGRRP